MFSLVPTDHSYREDAMRAEARAENLEEELMPLKQEISTAHRRLDFHVSRTIEYKRHGQRLLSLPERIDALVENVDKRNDEGWGEYRKQMRANAALVDDLKALRVALDDLEKENAKLRTKVRLKRKDP